MGGQQVKKERGVPTDRNERRAVRQRRPSTAKNKQTQFFLKSAGKVLKFLMPRLGPRRITSEPLDVELRHQCIFKSFSGDSNMQSRLRTIVYLGKIT